MPDRELDITLQDIGLADVLFLSDAELLRKLAWDICHQAIDLGRVNRRDITEAYIQELVVEHSSIQAMRSFGANLLLKGGKP